MCIICTHYDDGSLTGDEAIRNIREMEEVIGKEHAKGVMAHVINQEMDDILGEFDLQIDDLYPKLMG